MDKKNALLPLILKAVALAMGIAVLVLSVLGEADINTRITMLAIGLTSLALSRFVKQE